MAQLFQNHTILDWLPEIPKQYAIGSPQNSGFVKIRKKHNSLKPTYKVQILMNHSQYNSFMNWYKDTPGVTFQHTNELNSVLESYKIIPDSIQFNWIDKSRQNLIVTMQWITV